MYLKLHKPLWYKMPKTNVKGGKKKKRENGIFENKLNSKLVTAEEDQYYAKVVKILGNGRFSPNCYLLDKDNQMYLKMIENVCGKLEGKLDSHEDLVIITLESFQNLIGKNVI